MNGKSIDDIIRASDLVEFLSAAQSDATNVDVRMLPQEDLFTSQYTMREAEPRLVGTGGLGFLEAITGMGKAAQLAKSIPAITRLQKNISKAKNAPSLMDVIKASPKTMKEAFVGDFTMDSNKIKNVLGEEQLARFDDFRLRLKEFQSKAFDLDEFEKLAKERKELRNLLESVESYTQQTVSGGRPLMDTVKPGGLIDQRKTKQESLPQIVSLLNYLMK
tara:strand:+ start:552 stop:1208 length:657 start_codon:yes stop_codon:yes gene_type:complete